MADTARLPVPVAQRKALPAPDRQPLFRPEVIAERQTQWLGTVLLEPRISHSIFTSMALTAGIAVLALLLIGSYTRKAHINGWLVPQQGLARIVAPQVGVVTRIHVREGMTVDKGTPLLTLSAEIQSEARGATKEEVVRKLQNRRDSLANAKNVLEGQLDQEAVDLRRRLDVQRSRLALSETALARDRAMRARDLIALPRLQKTEQDYLDNQATLLTLEGTLRELPFRRQTQLAEMDRNIAALEQELAEAESRRQIVITAPQDGTVTAIQAEPGSTAQPSVPLMSIVPTGTVLQAQLFGPSRAIGFLQPGQRVLLRYQAYPYQKYGSYAGTVSSISRSAISPSELTQHLSGLTTIYGANEPLYRITVDLESQTAKAYGQPAPLQPGMQLEADVMIESRRLIEWVFDPLFTLTGKWHA
jgi:membrane fusion protein